jgi:hypothetical protein
VSVARAVEKDLAEIRKRDPDLADSGLAASALALARGIDEGASLAMRSMATKELRENLDRIRELAPKQKREDSIDRLAQQRAKRRAA